MRQLKNHNSLYNCITDHYLLEISISNTNKGFDKLLHTYTDNFKKYSIYTQSSKEVTIRISDMNHIQNKL